MNADDSNEKDKQGRTERTSQEFGKMTRIMIEQRIRKENHDKKYTRRCHNRF